MSEYAYIVSGMAMMTIDRARELFSYEPETGNIIRKVSRSANALKGDVAGTPDLHGYIQIQVDGKIYKAHRIAFLLMTGDWPKFAIDHANGNRSDNRWENIRECTQSENSRNSKLRSDNTSGYKGVCFYKNRWLAQIQIHGKCRHIGLYDTPKEAHEAYMKAAIAAQPDFARSE